MSQSEEEGERGGRSERLGWGQRNQAQMRHPRRLGDSLQGDELHVVEVNDSRLDTVLPERRVSVLPLHFLIRFMIQ